MPCMDILDMLPNEIWALVLHNFRKDVFRADLMWLWNRLRAFSPFFEDEIDRMFRDTFLPRMRIEHGRRLDLTLRFLRFDDRDPQRVIFKDVFDQPLPVPQRGNHPFSSDRPEDYGRVTFRKNEETRTMCIPGFRVESGRVEVSFLWRDFLDDYLPNLEHNDSDSDDEELAEALYGDGYDP